MHQVIAFLDPFEYLSKLDGFVVKRGFTPLKIIVIDATVALGAGDGR